MPVPIDPRWLRSFLETYLNRGKYRRLIASRHFQGYITAVTAVPTNANNESGTQYLCSVQRVEESQADGNTYLCVTPGYKPVVGDLVELMWRDENVAYVLWPINGTTNSSAGAITSVQAGPSGTPISGAVEIDAGPGIAVAESGQDLTISNTGVLSITAGVNGPTVNPSSGNVVISEVVFEPLADPYGAPPDAWEVTTYATGVTPDLIWTMAGDVIVVPT